MFNSFQDYCSLQSKIRFEMRAYPAGILFTFLFAFGFAINIYSQVVYPSGYFQSPMFLPFNLSGTFGEIRSNHFHSGLDIKTNEQEGHIVMAVAGGYISRIKVSATGFGKAVYIDHPNGFTTVYAHLHYFNDTIESVVQTEQYKKLSFEVDFLLDSLLLPIRQGQLIGFSGNTGGSEGPHLHFEIRDTKSEHPLNPLLFGYPIEDTIPPVIRNIKIYQVHELENGFITDTAWNVAVNDSEKISTSLTSDSILIFEKTVFSVECFDEMNNSNNTLGVNKIELVVDGNTIYTYYFDQFSFDETKYVNANIDYAERIHEGRKFILLYRQPGNQFSMLKKDTLMTGIILLNDNKVHEAEIRITDFNGNTSIKKLFLVNKISQGSGVMDQEPVHKIISYKKAPVVKLPGVKVLFPAAPLTYNVYPFIVKKEKKNYNSYSPVFVIAEDTIPIHTYLSLSIKPVRLPAALQSKAIIVSIDKHGKLSAEESRFANGWVSGKIRHFGKFTISVDTIPPTIKPLGIVPDTISNKNKILFNIADDLSGIKTYTLKINGEWALAEYDAKTGNLFYCFKNEAEGKTYEVNVEITDRKENKAVYETEILY